jgi:hypothetical protein
MLALSSLSKALKGGLVVDRLSEIQEARSYDREAVVTNVTKRQVEHLFENGVIMSNVASEELLTVGAFYEISTWSSLQGSPDGSTVSHSDLVGSTLL